MHTLNLLITKTIGDRIKLIHLGNKYLVFIGGARIRSEIKRQGQSSEWEKIQDEQLGS